MIKLTVTLKYRDETLVYFFSFIILFMTLFFLSKANLLFLVPLLLKKTNKKIWESKAGFGSSQKSYRPARLKAPFIYILFDVFENSEANKRGELIRQIPEGGETISIEFSTTSLGEGSLSWLIFMSHAYCLAHKPLKKKKKNSGQFIFLCLFRFYMGLFELKIMLGKNRSVLEFGNLNNKHSAFYLFYNFYISLI